MCVLTCLPEFVINTLGELIILVSNTGQPDDCGCHRVPDAEPSPTNHLPKFRLESTPQVLANSHKHHHLQCLLRPNFVRFQERHHGHRGLPAVHLSRRGSRIGSMNTGKLDSIDDTACIL